MLEHIRAALAARFGGRAAVEARESTAPPAPKPTPQILKPADDAAKKGT